MHGGWVWIGDCITNTMAPLTLREKILKNHPNRDRLGRVQQGLDCKFGLRHDRSRGHHVRSAPVHVWSQEDRTDCLPAHLPLLDAAGRHSQHGHHIRQQVKRDGHHLRKQVDRDCHHLLYVSRQIGMAIIYVSRQKGSTWKKQIIFSINLDCCLKSSDRQRSVSVSGSDRTADKSSRTKLVRCSLLLALQLFSSSILWHSSVWKNVVFVSLLSVCCFCCGRVFSVTFPAKRQKFTKISKRTQFT